VTWSPTKIVDISLAYKHEAVVKGSFTGSNGAIGSTTGAMRGVLTKLASGATSVLRNIHRP
jgi:hypothetical protein